MKKGFETFATNYPAVSFYMPFILFSTFITFALFSLSMFFMLRCSMSHWCFTFVCIPKAPKATENWLFVAAFFKSQTMAQKFVEQ